MRPPRWLAWWLSGCMVLLFAALIFGALARPSKAAEGIPAAVKRHRSLVVSAARWGLGPDAPVSVIGAQMMQESGGEESARSAVGAQGLAQIMPKTGEWLSRVRPDLGPPDPWNPAWALRAMAAYDAWLLERVKGRDKCQKWAAATASYNMGLGWWLKAAALAERLGLEPDVWFESTETVNPGQSDAAFRESRGYPKSILLKLAPRFERAGWGPGVCS